MTPREIARVFEGRSRFLRARHDLIMQAAWTSAALGRAKKMPPMKNLMLSPAAKPKRQNWQAMYAVAAAWAAERGSILK
ncbi:MAG: hypothetical protein ABIV36_02930 [Sphingobium limneticum]